MMICVSMWSVHRNFYQGGWTVMDFLQFCQEHDIKSVELLDIFWRNPSVELPQVQQFLADHGMTVGAYAVSNNFVEADESLREQSLHSVLQGIDMALQLGTTTVRVFAGDLREGYDFDVALEWIVAGLRRAADVAEQKAVTLAIENHGKLAGRSDQIQMILSRVGSSRLKSTFDMGNFLLVDESPVDAYECLENEIGHVHVKDFKQSPNQDGLCSLGGIYYVGTVCGDGEVPIRRLMERLLNQGYQGALSLEFEGSGDECASVLKSVENLNSLRG